MAARFVQKKIKTYKMDGLVVFKPGALHPVPTATIKALTRFCLSGLWPEIQATRYAGGR